LAAAAAAQVVLVYMAVVQELMQEVKAVQECSLQSLDQLFTMLVVVEVQLTVVSNQEARALEAMEIILVLRQPPMEQPTQVQVVAVLELIQDLIYPATVLLEL
jgi:hypothetical protein